MRGKIKEAHIELIHNGAVVSRRQGEERDFDKYKIGHVVPVQMGEEDIMTKVRGTRIIYAGDRVTLKVYLT